MFWLLKAARRLRRLGVLGMNGRNAAYILDHNPRARFPVVDDKLRMRGLCVRIGVPTPAVYGAIGYHSMLRRLADTLGGRDDFVIKPSRGSAGRGVLVVVGRDGADYLRHNGDLLRPDFWLESQRRVADGEIVDFFPYPEDVRFSSRRAEA